VDRQGLEDLQVTTKLRAGVIWANTYNKFDPTSPFGGYKESGHGQRRRPARTAAISELELRE
jgi:acyl-CoA reductase-like NAD-dependent aldehyde dehydrogenase